MERRSVSNPDMRNNVLFAIVRDRGMNVIVGRVGVRSKRATSSMVNVDSLCDVIGNGNH